MVLTVAGHFQRRQLPMCATATSPSTVAATMPLLLW
jgi:hypothetical protein